MASRMTITEAAEVVGVTPKTIMRWEDGGKVQRARRDWRGWRFYEDGDVEALVRFHDSVRYSYVTGEAA